MRNAKILAAAVSGVLVACVVGAVAGPVRLSGVYFERAERNCAIGFTCMLYFSERLTNLTVNKVSCNFYINATNVSLTGMQLAQTSVDKTNVRDGQFLQPPTAIMFKPDTSQYQSLSDTLHVIPKGWRPAVEINFNTLATSHAACTISGTEG